MQEKRDARPTVVLLVEHEPAMADLLIEELEAAGFEVSTTWDETDLVKSVKSVNPDLLLLDVMSPRHDVLSLCRELREFSDVPLMLVMPRNDEVDRLIAFELGADDCMCRPFSAREIVARIRAILRRAQRNPRASEGTGLVIDTEAYQAHLDGHVLDLTVIEFRLLTLLASRPRRVFSREILLERLYDDHRVVSERVVDTHIKNLKRKLKLVRPDDDMIRSIYGVGYRLTLPGTVR